MSHREMSILKGAKPFLAINALILALSFLTCFRVVPGPDILGIFAAFYTLFILPGMLLSMLISDDRTVSLETICRIFFSSLVVVSFLICLGFIPGISYSSIAGACGGINVILLFLYYRKARSGKKVQQRSESTFVSEGKNDNPRYTAGKVILIIVLFISCYVFFFDSGDIGRDTDSFDHLSFIRRSVSTGEIFPADSFYKDGDGAAFDPRKGIWHPAVSLWVFLSDTTPQFLWRVIPSFVVFFILASFLFFATELLGSPARAALALVFLFLFYRGEGITWLTKVGYSRNIAQAIFWFDIALLLRFYKGKNIRYLIGALFLSAVGSAVHLAFVLLLAVSLGSILIYILLSRSGANWSRRFLASLPFLAMAVAIPLIVRARFTFSHFNMIHTHRQGMLILSDQLAIVDPVEILSSVGSVFFFALLIIPFFFRIAADVERRNLVGILFLVPVVLVLNPYTAFLLESKLNYLHYRILYAAPLMCMLVLGITGLFRILLFGRGTKAAIKMRMQDRQPDAGQRRDGKTNVFGLNVGRPKRNRFASLSTNVVKRLVAAAVLILFLFYPVRTAIVAITGSVRNILYPGDELDTAYRRLIELLGNEVPDNSVIVSDPQTSYIISAYTNHFIVVTLDQHCSPSDTLAVDRLEEVRTLFSPAVPISVSIPWLKRSAADYILVMGGLTDRSDFFRTVFPEEIELTVEKLRTCRDLLQEIPVTEDFLLFKVNQDSLDVAASSGECRATYTAPLQCERYQESNNISSERVRAYERGKGDNAFEHKRVETGRDDSVRESGELVEIMFEDEPCIILERATIDDKVLTPGDTLRGSLCWRVVKTPPYGLPIECVVRLDTTFPQGAYYRAWYGKQYRRKLERDNQILYRYTLFTPLRSGCTLPDQWGRGDRVGQDFSITLPVWMAHGVYDLRIKLFRLPYIPNRTISDYLLNEDSFHGERVASLRIGTDEEHRGQ